MQKIRDDAKSMAKQGKSIPKVKRTLFKTKFYIKIVFKSSHYISNSGYLWPYRKNKTSNY